ncbi:MAG: hypothetical protein K2W92_07940 [Alphaproteobacteria bacterium]|nr:hypothetical protein [Alphaproteobacteria bacterium]
MKKTVVLALALFLLFSMDEGNCGYFIEYPDFGVEDPPKTERKQKGHLYIEDIVEEDMLRGPNIEGINLRANRLTTEGMRYLVAIITSPENAERFKNLKYINLTANPVDVNVFEVCRPLLERETFKFLDIRRTPASETSVFFYTLESTFPEVWRKIIYIPPCT